MDAFFKPSRNWKRPLITTGCILLLTLGIYVVYILSFAAISFVAGTSYVDSLSLFYVAAVKWIFNAHVSAIWIMSLVVTVLEDNISGLKAINRAEDIMKGNRIQITLLVMLYYGGGLLIRKMFDAFSLIFEEWVFEEVWALKIPFVTGCDLFLFVLFTVLYHECKADNKVDSVSDKAS
ncbi:uncharacterized protein LOC143534637 [Bidens hawaiensis]|uniref:uncharacterized protein LOC143534537 n=1 Tax=Bidens hawaiensis TaxID=980011 RepID=UPI00404B3916